MKKKKKVTNTSVFPTSLFISHLIVSTYFISSRKKKEKENIKPSCIATIKAQMKKFIS